MQGGQSVDFGAETSHAIYEWNDNRTPDKLMAQYARCTKINPSKGYWFKSLNDTTLTMNTTALSELKSVETTLKLNLVHAATGWNCISSPFPFAINPSWLGTFTAWEWNADSLGYRKASSLHPWKAYWVYTERDTSLQIWEKLPLSSYLSRSLAKATVTPTNWRLRLSLSGNNSYDIDNFIGVVPKTLAKSKQLSTPEPPAAFGGTRLYIIDHLADNHETQNNPVQLAHLYKPVSDKKDKLEWMIGISSSSTASRLHVGDIENLPENLYAFWVDRDRIVNLREIDTISFGPQTNDQFGYIVITGNPADLSLYTSKLTLNIPFPNPSRGSATIQYILPYVWSSNGSALGNQKTTFSLSLYDITGRHIVKLIDEKRGPGIYRTIWKGENKRGHQVAAGMYIMKLLYGKQQKVVRLYRIQ
jgi:hypothetical protein